MAAGARNAPDTIEASIRIERSLDEVFDFYSDLRNIPRFVGDVVSSEPVGSDSYRWVVQGPAGARIRWVMKVTKREKNAELRYESSAFLGFKATWDIRFARGGNPGETEVREALSIPLGRPGRVALAIIGKYPGEEVLANLQRLKQVIESEPEGTAPAG